MEYLSYQYGLVTDSDSVTENGQLFLAELILLSDSFICYRSIMFEQLERSYAGEKGLYHRNSDLTNKRIMSHDNLSGIFSYSFTVKNDIRFDIWNYLLKHLGTYDNSKGKSKQLSRFLPFNPSNFFIWGLCVESKIYLMFLPFFLVNFILACDKPVNITTGKLLLWVELLPHKNHWLVKYFYRYFEKKMKKMYGNDYLKQLFFIYFRNESKEFPIKKILRIE